MLSLTYSLYQFLALPTILLAMETPLNASLGVSLTSLGVLVIDLDLRLNKSTSTFRGFLPGRGGGGGGVAAGFCVITVVEDEAVVE